MHRRCAEKSDSSVPSDDGSDGLCWGLLPLAACCWKLPRVVAGKKQEEGKR